MLSKLSVLVQSKVAIAVLGVALVGGGGTVAAMAASGNHIPFASALTSHDSTKTPEASASGDEHAHTVSIEGVLLGYDATASTISVQGSQSSTPTTIKVDSSTKVNGSGMSVLADLANAKGHKVEVSATKQSDGSLVAWKVTVGAAGTAGDNSGEKGDAAESADVDGTVASVGSSSFVVTVASGKTITVTVNSQTQYGGAASSFADVKANERISASGSMQSDGTFAAARVEVDTDASSGTDHQQTTADGTVVAGSVTASSFQIKLENGTTITVDVSSATQFSGSATSLSGLQANMRVTVSGSMASAGTMSATAVLARTGD